MAGSALLKLASRGLAPATGIGVYLTPEDAEASFGGILARGADEIIYAAEDLARKGVSREEIWKQTYDQFGKGAYQGPDGLWRVEFTDFIDEIRSSTPEGMSIMRPLNETLQGQPILEAYPSLGRVDHLIDPQAPRNEASYTTYRTEDPVDDSVQINEVIETGASSRNVGRYRELGHEDIAQELEAGNRQVNSSVLHETQHAVQNREAFAGGSTPERAGSYDAYRRVAGEAEARNVEIRARMSAEERRNNPPWMTQDVPMGQVTINPEETDRIKKAINRQNARLTAFGLGAFLTGGAASAENILDAVPESTRDFVAKAREQGISDEVIVEYLEQKGHEFEKPEVDYAHQELGRLTDEEIEEARRAGYSEEVIAQYNQGDEQLNYAELDLGTFAQPDSAFMWEREVPGGVDSTGPNYEELNEHEVKRIAADLGVDPRTQVGMNAVYSTAKRRNFNSNTTSMVANLQEIANVDRPWQWLQSNFSNEANNEYQRASQDNITAIVDMARERGLELTYNEGRFWAPDPQSGELQHVTPGFLESIGKSKFEIAGGIGGAGAGAALVRALGPYGRKLQLAGAAVGGITGAAAGENLDYLSAAIAAQEEWDAKIAAEKTMGAAQMAAVGEVLGYGIYKAGAGTFRYLRQAYNQVKDGNTEGAYRAMKEGLGYVSDDEIEQMIERWQRLNDRAAPGANSREQALAVAPATMSGGESIIRATASLDPAASTAVAADINQRAQDLLTAARSSAPEDTSARLINNLRSYETEVKTNFGVVKQRGIDLAPTNYRFDMDRISIQPLIEHKMSTITDPATVTRLQNILTRIEGLTTSRSFDDLLELRRTVNDYKFNKNINNPGDYDAINEVLSNIDNQIDVVSRQSDEGIEWLDDWKDANRSYARYAQVRGNVLWRALTKPGVSADDAARAVLRHGDALDNTYTEVMEKLSPQVRANVESAMVDRLVNQYAAGQAGEFRAIQFPMLEEAMRPYNFSAPEAQRMKQAIGEMAEVYRNDVRLVSASGQISLPTFQSYLTTDPVVRAQYEVASSIFNSIKRLVPGRKADALAMVNKVGKLLEDPLNTSVATDVLNRIKGDQELTAAVTRLQASMARDMAQSGERTARAKIYSSGNGQLYLQPGPRRREAGESIPLHRIAQEDSAKVLLGVDRITRDTLSVHNRIKLMDEGFAVIRLNDGQIIRLNTGVPGR